MTSEASTTTWETLVEQYRERAARDDARIEELMQRANHWHDTADILKRQRNQAEKERDALRKDAARVCKWGEDDLDFGTWRTGCGHLWSFNAGGPEENDAKFCQYCGGALAVALSEATP